MIIRIEKWVKVQVDLFFLAQNNNRVTSTYIPSIELANKETTGIVSSTKQSAIKII